MRCPWSRWTRGDLTGTERCAANQAAGEITFLTGFLFFPAISIAVVLAAEDQGFFDDMCLDVNIVPSVPGESIVLISANVIQFSTNQIGELSQAQEQGAQSTMVLNYGHTPVHVLLVEDDSPILEPADFAGATIGSVGGTLNAGLQGLLLNGGGLSVDEDYEGCGSKLQPVRNRGVRRNRGLPLQRARHLEQGRRARARFPPRGLQLGRHLCRHPGEHRVRPAASAGGGGLGPAQSGRHGEWSIANPEETVRIAEALCSECGFFEFEHELFRFNEEVKAVARLDPEGHVFGAITLRRWPRRSRRCGASTFSNAAGHGGAIR